MEALPEMIYTAVMNWKNIKKKGVTTRPFCLDTKEKKPTQQSRFSKELQQSHNYKQIKMSY